MINRHSSLFILNSFMFRYLQQWRIQDLTLGGGVDFVKGGGGSRKIIESVNIWLISPILAWFCPTSIKIMLIMYREQSERKKRREHLAFWA